LRPISSGSEGVINHAPTTAFASVRIAVWRACPCAIAAEVECFLNYMGEEMATRKRQEAPRSWRGGHPISDTTEKAP